MPLPGGIHCLKAQAGILFARGLNSFLCTSFIKNHFAIRYVNSFILVQKILAEKKYEIRAGYFLDNNETTIVSDVVLV